MSREVSLVVFGSIATLIAVSFLQWTGRWRSWYRPNDPSLSILFTTLGPSPLLVPALLGGVLAMVGLIFVSSAIHLRALIDVGIAAGLAGILIAGWIAFRQPQWALPGWMREHQSHDRLRR